MNTSAIKKYAPKARKDFIAAVTRQAAVYGITENSIAPADIKGDYLIIADKTFPSSIASQHAKLVKRIEQQGFAQTMEAVAYSWFNRLIAIRYMELHDYLDHGRRVLSHPTLDNRFQIVEECADIDFPGLDKANILKLKLDGTQDEILFRELLLAQCHALHGAMPFLFEAVDTETELLLPGNLTQTNSIIHELVTAIPEADWQHVEIVGWLYQFYISEKKDQVIGKVVKSKDIPAATQLFTPNWIVQYLVQNSIGRQWLQTYPDSPLKEKMPYYIEPAEQAPEVLAQIAEITPSEIDPETLKVLDPACGSGHILVEAYKILKAIYEERGYRSRDIPKLILENNLFGLDIDDRAGQLAGFALMMLAREDDRRIFSRDIRLNVLAIQESSNINLPSLWRALNLDGEPQSGTTKDLFEEEKEDLSTFSADDRYQLLLRTLELFKQAKTFGSLIDVPAKLLPELLALQTMLEELAESGDTIQQPAARTLLPLVRQAIILAQRYDAVVANPPYMGSKGMNADLKAFTKKHYSNSKADLFAVFMERAFELLIANGYNAQVTMQSWMFLSSYEKMRENLLDRHTILTMAHMGNGVMRIAFGTNATVFSKLHINGYVGSFSYTENEDTDDNGIPRIFPTPNARLKTATSDDFNKIPGSPIAYWVSHDFRNSFVGSKKLGDIGEPRLGMATGNNNLHLRLWQEVANTKIGYSLGSRNEAKLSNKKWFPYNKGGQFRRWFGNNEYVVNWENDGSLLRNMLDPTGARVWAHNFNLDYIFKQCLTFTATSATYFGVRFSHKGFLFDNKGSSYFTSDEYIYVALGLLASKPATVILKALNPTVETQPGNISVIPFFKKLLNTCIHDNVLNSINIGKKDWDSFEPSWDFAENPLLAVKCDSVKLAFKAWLADNAAAVKKMQQLEEENNRLFIDAYGLQDELTPDVPLEQITLTVNPRYRYGGNASDADLELRFQSDTCAELISYAIGCMMGRYRINKPGLAYAHAGNVDFEKIYYDKNADNVIFTADAAAKAQHRLTKKLGGYAPDDDGIIPLTDQEWFPDDATNRLREFVNVVWGEKHLQENIDFIAESLCLYAIKPPRKGQSESALDTIRRYLSTQFYKDHLKTYKKRPIYWLFSSGKQKAFECLVYLHRYNEGTLARMRTEYVIPLTAKMAAYVQKLENDKEASGSTAETKRLEKEIALLHKQQTELSEFDEKLRHYADQRISLDLDDGVKVNYGKFGDLLAQVKAIHGEIPSKI